MRGDGVEYVFEFNAEMFGLDNKLFYLAAEKFCALFARCVGENRYDRCLCRGAFRGDLRR